MSFDVLIRGGTVFDGTGAPGAPLDVGIRDGRIAAVGPAGDFAGAVAAAEVDARARYVTPGFVDLHSHSDRVLLVNPRMESKIRQGITTELGGNCGQSPAPILGEALGRAQVDSFAAGGTESWPTMAAYFADLERSGIAGNFAILTAHGTLRASTVGYADRPPTAAELARMAALLRESLADGAWGLSTGLPYVPGRYAETDEVVALAAVVREYGGVYCSHLRDEGHGLVEAVAEAIEIGRRAGVPAHIAHHKAAGRSNWGTTERTLAMLDRALDEGVDVACDVYAYTAGSTGLYTLFPEWAQEGGREGLLARLRDPGTGGALRARVREDMAALAAEAAAAKAVRDGGGRPERTPRLADDPLGFEAAWDLLTLSAYRPDPSLEGRDFASLAAERGVDPADLALDLYDGAAGNVGVVLHSMGEVDVENVLRWRRAAVSTDGRALAPYGPLGVGKPHPRSYGGFPRVLSRYVRERGVLSWEQAVHKMTGLPAARIGLADRGRIEAGRWADVVVLDPLTVGDRGTFADPHVFPAGIGDVLVNGVPVVRDGEHTGALPGRVLRHGH